MKTLFHLRIEPSPTVEKSADRELAVEGLRGCAAVAVLYFHVTAPGPLIDPVYIPSHYLGWGEVGVMAVLLFFILSGYVIGLTNTRAPTQSSVTDYLKRRGVRLLPIYLLALTFGWLVTAGATGRDFLGHLFFLQSSAPDAPLHFPLLKGNPNLWSLPYEVVYYLLFILLWKFSPPAFAVMGAGFGLLGLATFTSAMPIWLGRLAGGALFWIAGLLIAWRLPRAAPTARSPWPSIVLLCVATWRLNVFGTIAERFGFQDISGAGMHFSFLDSLPVLLWLFLGVARRQTRWVWCLELWSWSLPSVLIAWRFAHGSANWPSDTAFATFLVGAAAVLRGWKPRLDFWERLAPLGGISYGLYAFAAPVQHVMPTLIPSWSGRWWTYSVRVLITVGLVFGIAAFAERWCQPRIRALLQPFRLRPVLKPT